MRSFRSYEEIGLKVKRLCNKDTVPSFHHVLDPVPVCYVPCCPSHLISENNLAVSIAFMYMQGHWGLEKFSKFPKVTSVVGCSPIYHQGSFVKFHLPIYLIIQQILIRSLCAWSPAYVLSVQQWIKRVCVLRLDSKLTKRSLRKAPDAD